MRRQQLSCSIQGGKLTRPSQKDLVQCVTVGGRRLLHYPAPVIDVAVLRGTTADVAGNIGFEREAVLGDSLNQVLRLAAAGFASVQLCARCIEQGHRCIEERRCSLVTGTPHTAVLC